MSNFIFSRRAMQTSIGRLARVLDDHQLLPLIHRLNLPGRDRLPAMWELMMLDALSGFGKLRYEIQLTDGRRPDIDLTVSTPQTDSYRIIGDITTVSDAGRDKDNPVGELSDELTRLAAKAGLNPNHFGFAVSGDRDGPFGNARMKLSLPARGRLRSLMQQEVMPWLHQVKLTPHQSRQFAYDKQGVAFSLTYNPAQLYATGNYVRYDVAASRHKNPLFTALKSKADQLRQAPDDALRLIVACDGDCALFGDTERNRTHGTYTAHAVTYDFLRQYSSVDAVLLVTIDEKFPFPRIGPPRVIEWDLVFSPPRTRSSRLTPSSIASLEMLLSDALRCLPEPMRSPRNAVVLCAEPGCGPDRMGDYGMKLGHSVRLSSRGLQRLLAGEISVQDFIADHGWNDPTDLENPFSNMKRLGRMIAGITVEKRGDQDDDWLIFTFGQPDPAAAPFQVPCDKSDPETSE